MELLQLLQFSAQIAKIANACCWDCFFFFCQFSLNSIKYLQMPFKVITTDNFFASCLNKCYMFLENGPVHWKSLHSHNEDSNIWQCLYHLCSRDLTRSYQRPTYHPYPHLGQDNPHILLITKLTRHNRYFSSFHSQL